MKIADFLKLPKTKEQYIDDFTHRLNLFGVYDSNLTDLNVYNLDISKIEVFNVFDDCLDGRRGLWIYYATYENEPFAFWYTAGREGNDSKKGFVINKDVFKNAIGYLRTFTETDLDNEVDINTDFRELNKIYGYDLTNLILKPNHELKFKVDDIVEISNFSYINLKNETIRAKIIRTNNKTDLDTYVVELLDYKEVPTFVKGVVGSRGTIFTKLFPKNQKLKISDIYLSNDELTAEQNEVIQKYINSNKSVKFPISYKDENDMKLL
jgi:hypothetical protein